MIFCPICNSRRTGKINRGRFFCGECCHEWTIDGGKVTVYKITDDGTVVPLKIKISASTINMLKKHAV